MKALRLLAAALLVALASPAFGATTLVSPIPTLSAVSHNWVDSLTVNGLHASQPAVADLANVGAGTVLGNPSGSSAAPSATSTPVLGVAASTAGSLGIANGGGGGNVATITSGATSAYNFVLPANAGSSGQVLESGGGSTLTWATISSSLDYTITNKTSGYTTGNGDSSTTFTNTGAGGAVVISLPSSGTTVAGEWHCANVTAAQTLEFLAASGQTISVGGATGATGGNIQSNVVGNDVCLYAVSTTSWVVRSMTGSWTLS